MLGCWCSPYQLVNFLLQVKDYEDNIHESIMASRHGLSSKVILPSKAEVFSEFGMSMVDDRLSKAAVKRHRRRKVLGQLQLVCFPVCEHRTDLGVIPEGPLYAACQLLHMQYSCATHT